MSGIDQIDHFVNAISHLRESIELLNKEIEKKDKEIAFMKGWSEAQQDTIDRLRDVFLTDEEIDGLVTLYAAPNAEGYGDDEHWDLVEKTILAIKRKMK